MDLTAINRSATGVHAPAPAVTSDKVAEKREVVQAVKAVNGTEMFGRKTNCVSRKIRKPTGSWSGW